MTTTLTPTKPAPASAKKSNGLTPWFKQDPFRSMREEFDHLLSRITEGWNGDTAAESRMRLPMLDLAETDKELQLTMDLPGVKADEVNIELSGKNLRISGEHKEEQEEKTKTYHRIERQVGSFYRSVDLPCEINEDKIVAECKDGVLKVTLPKCEAAVTKKVKVKG